VFLVVDIGAEIVVVFSHLIFGGAAVADVVAEVS